MKEFIGHVRLTPAAAPDTAAPAAEWMDAALCLQFDPEMWFPLKCGSIRHVEQAKRICRSCAVRPECLSFALDNKIHEGIYGGLTERQRRNMKIVPKDAA